MQTLKKIYFVANARMPSEKANGIHIAKMCEALIKRGYDVTLVVPSRVVRVRSLGAGVGRRLHFLRSQRDQRRRRRVPHCC